MTKRLTPARFVALYELAVSARKGMVGHVDKRSLAALLDDNLIEQDGFTVFNHPKYRATASGWTATRDHLDYLAGREDAGRVYRTANEQQFQANAAHYRAKLDEVQAEASAAAVETGDRVTVPVSDEDGAERATGVVREVYKTEDEALVSVRLDSGLMRFIDFDRLVQAVKVQDEPEAVPAPLPKRPAGGSAIADAGNRFRTPLPVIRVGMPVTITSVPEGRRVSGTTADLYQTETGESMVVITDHRFGVTHMGTLATATAARSWGPGPWRYQGRENVTVSCTTDSAGEYHVSLSDSALSVRLTSITFATLAERDAWLSDVLYDHGPVDAA